MKWRDGRFGMSGGKPKCMPGPSWSSSIGQPAAFTMLLSALAHSKDWDQLCLGSPQLGLCDNTSPVRETPQMGVYSCLC
jgi:hypothetical protein